RASQGARRAVAWQVALRALAPVALAEDLPADVPAAMPRFQTWYGRDDFQRMFHRLYLDLGEGGRRARAPLVAAAIDDALGWNAQAVHEAPSWPADRFQAYLAAIDEEAEVGGVGGIGRVAYSPGALRHLLTSYAETLPCVNGDPPPAFAEGEAPPVRALTREAVDLGACERRELGPFFVATGEELHASLDGETAASLRLLAGPPEAREEVCAADPGEPCAAPGPGPITVEVAARGEGGRATVAVELGEAQPTWAACLAGPFPLDAAVVKADWRRSDFGAELPVHDTSADALARRLAGGQDWGEGEATADPGPDDIYTVVLPGGESYRLAALHIMTKELDHWMWVTLWWSPDPDTDFGADRPAAVASLAGPWAHYKMCTTAWFREEDADPTGGARAPSLAAALAATHPGAGGPSWCSNPYLEIGAGNAATNCTGCHQHGGTGLLPEVILDDPRFPERGRLQVRNNFATDYSWAVDSGDKLGRVIADEVDYYDSFE
ncbi:MAG TPA: hypothetical protein VKB80_37060, partial [Kofleriaceae bacterium]|nr:hypothetical protein [Kofleriaceae bacterium]